jgi:hypothetical protein
MKFKIVVEFFCRDGEGTVVYHIGTSFLKDLKGPEV